MPVALAELEAAFRQQLQLKLKQKSTPTKLLSF
jgi:hypothetical protein